MDDLHFTIRYWQRTHGDTLILLVEDAAGRLLLCTGQGLRRFLHEAYEPTRRAANLRALGWMPVPEGAPHTFAGLRDLLGPAIAA
jgi:hypothetical protein